MAISNHLKLVSESYGKHLLFTLKLSLHLLLLCIVSIIHGLIPWVFSGQVSHGLKNIISTLEERTKIKK